MRLDYAYASHVGGRETNQDEYGQIVTPDGSRACFVLADGLGGHGGGQTASRIAVGAALEFFDASALDDPVAFLAQAFNEANRRILDAAANDPSIAQMKTTLTLLVILGDQAWWGHIGDTRLYHFEGPALANRTLDHSVVQMLVDMGEIEPEEIRGHPDQNRLVRCLGVRETLRPAIRKVGMPCADETVFLLCTDGLWGMIEESEMSAHIARNLPARDTLANLMTLALQRAGERSDNVTAQLVRYKF